MLAQPRSTPLPPAAAIPSLPAPPASSHLASTSSGPFPTAPPPPPPLPPSPPPPRRDFNQTLLRPFIKRILAAPDVTSAVWERDAEILGNRAHEWASEIKKRMVGEWSSLAPAAAPEPRMLTRRQDLEPRGYKYLVTVSVSERGSSSASSGSGRAVLATFWDPLSDVAVSEVFQNDTVVVAVLAVAIRILY
ncbi:SPOSA6832_01231 [Sporobolomyces salmonicolor]|uniref:SPOSA6832_01231-mRNA-1:cds n=1 Tax=Sporidiobolus salmonicolor TaxID=5005 RepID=A0A0D6EIB1_SPOSA|nr:SPOSA6832_01231 [Sporobolomyces salmonicolor]